MTNDQRARLSIGRLAFSYTPGGLRMTVELNGQELDAPLDADAADALGLFCMGFLDARDEADRDARHREPVPVLGEQGDEGLAEWTAEDQALLDVSWMHRAERAEQFQKLWMQRAQHAERQLAEVLSLQDAPMVVETALGARAVVSHPAQKLAIEAFAREQTQRTEQALTSPAYLIDGEWVPRERIINAEDRAALDELSKLEDEMLAIVERGWSCAPEELQRLCRAELARREAKR